ncbi:glycosyltransferase family 2 protein [Pedobacter sp. HDW13]|uniref:glycosyltransferase family 2 protein n=1 Tax=unclassified Pedobacter TaxID=2628915 RepID=UPI000F5AF92D|nr:MULTISPECIES: glycosyltransferase family 2 protein [unclassified Pedobacter]QIL39730.1 glycosyltransferase family 2 protein [Pedobacter sp. HDW13]RQO79788.1 glycosyltransferase family 2 protein [Pedobacter sp. KBW01]
MQKSVSIVIPNYNGRHLLEKYLPSVFAAAENANTEFEVIVIDDGSKDDSILFIKANYQHVKLLINDRNRGFSFTCNHGISEAKYELILLLNSDVKLTPNYFEHQWKYFNKPDTFGVMARIMSFDETRIEDAARLLYYSGCRIKANKFYYSENAADEEVYTAYLSGANALVDATKLKELGGFDEIYSPFSSEDFDLSLRAWQLGWKCYYEHRSSCFHHVSGSTKTQIKSNFIKKIYYRNRYILQGIHLHGLRKALYPLQQAFTELIPKLLTGKTWVLESYKDYLAHKDLINDSKAHLEALKHKYNSNLNVSDVMAIINQSVNHKKIKRL